MSARLGAASLGCVALLLLALGGCSLAPLAQSVTPYNSRTLEYHAILSDGSVDPNPAMIIVYDSTGKQAGKFVSTYDASGNVTRTDIYQYNSDGTTTLLGHYSYTYQAATSTLPELLTKGEAFDASGNPKEYYDITYAVGAGMQDHYTDIADYTVDAAGNATESTDHVVTYITDTNNPAAGGYRTEQYFTFDSSGTESLQSEYVAYYLPPDANGYVNEQAELYHVIRGSSSSTSTVLPSGVDEAYFYTKFSYDAQENTYMQTDYLYGNITTKSGLPTDIPAARYDSTTHAFIPVTGWNVDPAAGNPDPLPYTINTTCTPSDETCVGNQVDTILYQYNSDNNPVKELLYVKGQLQEERTFSWKDPTHVTSKNLFVNGGNTLQQRDTTKYYPTTVGGVSYQVWDTTTYYFGLGPAKGTALPKSHFLIERGLKSFPLFEPTGSSAQGLLQAIGGQMFHRMAALHD